MRPQELEPEIEELLLRLMPDLADRWKGATEDEIERLETIAGRELPRFYRWFLLRMGHDPGPMGYPTLDFAAPTILSAYEKPLFPPAQRFFMIGYETNDMMPLHLLYDFEREARDDAMVTKRLSMGGAIHDQFETFREMIAWGQVLTHHVTTAPVCCQGFLIDDQGDALSKAHPVLESLGFTAPVPTGSRCGVYESDIAALITRARTDEPPGRHYFYLGGPDAGRLRSILGEVAAETSLEVKIDEWTPPLR